jgi:hypothetical protein
VVVVVAGAASVRQSRVRVVVVVAGAAVLPYFSVRAVVVVPEPGRQLIYAFAWLR